MEAKPKTTKPDYGAALIGSVLCVFTLCLYLLAGPWHPVGVPCSGHTVDGRLTFRGDWAYVVDQQNNYFVVSQLYNNGSRGQIYTGPMEALRRLGPDTPLHAEFCESALVSLSSRGTPIFVRSQEGFDRSTDAFQTVFLYLSASFFAIALYGFFVIWRSKHTLAR